MAGGIDKQTIANPQSHYGSPKAATWHFIAQRLTGAANVLFTVFFAWLVVRLAGAERAEMVGVIAHPLVAALLALLVINVPMHMRIGMREIIEDYVHEPRLNRFSLMLNNFFAFGVMVVALGAIAKLVFWG